MKKVFQELFMWLALILLLLGVSQSVKQLPLEYEESDFQRNGE